MGVDSENNSCSWVWGEKRVSFSERNFLKLKRRGGQGDEFFFFYFFFRFEFPHFSIEVK
jgi:hypothetical protein